MSIKKRFTIERISYRDAMDIVVKNHYLHRVAPCSIAFALIDNTRCSSDFFRKHIAGVVCYGVSCSSTLLKGLCGDDEAGNVYELTRLWTEDNLPCNVCSFLIGNTIKKLDKEIIVSFAEINAGHSGIVYQASNFCYCGLSAKFRDIKVKGLEHQHHATYANGMSINDVKNKYGAENVYFIERSRKHRYVYINAKRKRKAALLNKLKYRICDYPKAEQQQVKLQGENGND